MVLLFSPLTSQKTKETRQLIHLPQIGMLLGPVRLILSSQPKTVAAQRTNPAVFSAPGPAAAAQMDESPMALRVPFGGKALLAVLAGPGAQAQMDGLTMALQGE
jgi:hypothetical protein